MLAARVRGGGNPVPVLQSPMTGHENTRHAVLGQFTLETSNFVSTIFELGH